jgi:hypothetical protein
MGWPPSWNTHGTEFSTLSSNTDEETPVQRHEVPTHLNIEDKAFAGLTMRRLMVAIIGLALAYSAMSEAPLPLAVRLAAGAPVLLMTAARIALPAGDASRSSRNATSATVFATNTFCP